MNIVGIRFNDNGKKYLFDSNNLELRENITVIVETDKGLQFGKVVSLNESLNGQTDLKKVIRKSTKRDYLQHLNNLKDAKDAIIKCRELVEKNNLTMTIMDASYTFDRGQLIFRFIADERVDFRQLAKDLGSLFKTRIELRQVGIRDKAKEIGGLGPCGRKLCCSAFLTEFESVSINMAKNQSLALNPSKINGVCGRLLCCLNYEDDQYTELKREFPSIGTIVKHKNVSGKVISHNLFKRTFDIESVDKTIVTIDLDEYEGSK